MKIVTRSLSLGSVLLLAAVWASASFAAEPKISCQPADSWVSKLQQPPSDYESITALPIGQRKAAYRQLSDEERAGLWRHQWSAALETGEWSDRQRALLAEAARLFGGEAFALTRSRQETEAHARLERSLEDFERRMKVEFSKEAAFALFYTLGSWNEGEGMLSSECNCDAEEGSGCPSWANCRHLICVQVPEDCGLVWIVGPCTGICRNV